MTKSKLITNLANHYPSLMRKDVTKMVDIVLSNIINALRKDEFGAVEIRNFGRFSRKKIKARLNARNPRTGEQIQTQERKSIAFKMSKELKNKINKKESKIN